MPEHEAAEAPCVIRSGLLQPDLDDVHRLRPVAPALALPRLLRGIAEDIALRRRAETRPAEAFEPLPALGTGPAPDAGTGLITLLSGVERISDAIRHAMLRSCDEVLTIQPGGKRPVPVLAAALPMEQELLSRGGRMRTLYRHTTRYDPAVLAHYECLDGDVEVRTLDQCPGRQRLPVGANVACWGTRSPTASSSSTGRSPSSPPTRTGRWPRRSAIPRSSPTWPPRSTASGAWRPPCTRKPSSVPPSTASRPAGAPSRPPGRGPHGCRHRPPARHERPHGPAAHRQARRHPRQPSRAQLGHLIARSGILDRQP